MLEIPQASPRLRLACAALNHATGDAPLLDRAPREPDRQRRLKAGDPAEMAVTPRYIPTTKLSAAYKKKNDPKADIEEAQLSSERTMGLTLTITRGGCRPARVPAGAVRPPSGSWCS